MARDLAWELATDLTRQLPDDLGDVSDFDGSSDHDGPLNRAINHSYSKALETLYDWDGGSTATSGRRRRRSSTS